MHNRKQCVRFVPRFGPEVWCIMDTLLGPNIDTCTAEERTIFLDALYFVLRLTGRGRVLDTVRSVQRMNNWGDGTYIPTGRFDRSYCASQYDLLYCDLEYDQTH